MNPHIDSIVSPELIFRIGNGDSDAFRQLYDQTGELLLALALRILEDGDEAADLLCEAYERMKEKAGSYSQTEGSPFAWVVGVTHEAALARRHSRQRAASIEPGDTQKVDQPELVRSPVIRYERPEHRDIQAVVKSALHILPKDQLKTLQLAYYEGMSSLEIAEHLQESEAGINAKIRLALYRLRASLQPCWVKEPG